MSNARYVLIWQNDTITDFSKAQGDKLDLSGLLSDAVFNKTLASDIAKYLQLSASGSHAVLKVDVTGGGNFSSPTQFIHRTGAHVGGNLLDSDLVSLLAQRVFVV